MQSTWTGRRTLITGASAGIGKAFAEALAERGSDLVLTARRLDRLEALASQLRSAHGVSIACCTADLEDPAAAETIFAFTRERNLPIDFLINNAGFGTYGEFWKSDGGKQTGMVRVHCESVVRLTHLFLPEMIERRRGDILILSSTAGFQAVPYMSVYAATKGFDLLFAEALAREVKRYGIRVCALCPGSTESDFDHLAGIPTERTAQFETAEKVVRVGLKAIEAGKHSVISGFLNQAATQLQRLATRKLVTSITEKMFRPK